MLLLFDFIVESLNLGFVKILEFILILSMLSDQVILHILIFSLD